MPYLSDIPLLGMLFRYDSHDKERTEMLIILTPHIVRSPEDAERVRQMEESRMHWCLCDVNQVHGPAGFSVKPEPQAAPVIYPDANPRGTLPPPAQEPGGPQPLREPPAGDGAAGRGNRLPPRRRP